MNLKNCMEIRLRYQSFSQKEPEILKKKIQDLTKGFFSFSSIRLPVKKKRVTLLRSPHVNKKSREQLEVCLHNGLYILKGFSVNASFLEAIQKLVLSQMSLKFSVITSKK